MIKFRQISGDVDKNFPTLRSNGYNKTMETVLIEDTQAYFELKFENDRLKELVRELEERVAELEDTLESGLN